MSRKRKAEALQPTWSHAEEDQKTKGKAKRAPIACHECDRPLAVDRVCYDHKLFCSSDCRWRYHTQCPDCGQYATTTTTATQSLAVHCKCAHCASEVEWTQCPKHGVKVRGPLRLSCDCVAQGLATPDAIELLEHLMATRAPTADQQLTLWLTHYRVTVDQLKKELAKEAAPP